MTQWQSRCRCNLPYAPGSSFSIDICNSCKKRIAKFAKGRVIEPYLCQCSEPIPVVVPHYMKPKGVEDPIEVDLRTLSLSNETFPTERYKPIGILGDDAKECVILCRDRQTGLKVAVKCYRRTDPAFAKAFEKEGGKVRKLSHPKIAKLSDFGKLDDKIPYTVTEYKDGFNIEQCLSLYGIPTYDVAVTVLLGICEALLAAQREQVVHNNLKPGNVIFFDDLNSEPSVSVVDFPLYRGKKFEDTLERNEVLYLSADEARGLDFNEKSAIYTIGCIGFALLTGRPPFDSGSAREIKNKHGLELPPRISSLKFDNSRPGDLEEVIERCLEKDPNQRFESIEKLKERLEIFPQRVRRQIAAIQAEKKKQQTIRIAIIATVALVLAGIVVAIAANR